MDLDGLGCYAAIHGLDPGALDERALQAVPVVALGRFCELFAAVGVKATLFAIGAEVGLPGAARVLKAAAGAGHEIASHTYGHDYALSRRPEKEISADLERCEQELLAAGLPGPRGVRAPGYTLSTTFLGAVRERGYLYDSSLLPSPPYYAAKAVAIAAYRLRGRDSRSILGTPGQLFARRAPHWLHGVRELPIATVPALRFPVIGTTVLALPGLARAGFAGGHLNLELHGIDALDRSDVPPEIAAVQPGLSMPASRKLLRLRAILARFDWQTLETVARRLLPD